MQRVKYWMHKVKYWMHIVEYWMHIVKYWMRSVEYWMQRFEYCYEWRAIRRRPTGWEELLNESSIRIRLILVVVDGFSRLVYRLTGVFQGFINYTMIVILLCETITTWSTSLLTPCVEVAKSHLDRSCTQNDLLHESLFPCVHCSQSGRLIAGVT